ncbi:hypothetical protein [Modestobacter sp. Leaf380]|uniref:hypothetical protein n=1 Tax=Modestobacter sp. Leaf380 TaxID=1736356 RepID=UPI0012FA3149|nr:hypothetical protein [Modestobacter sp. Leaf380]
MQTKAARRAALRSERRQAYSAFTRAANEFNFLMGTRATTAARTRNGELLLSLLADLREKMATLENARVDVDLLASKEVSDSSHEMLGVASTAFALLARSLDPDSDFDREQWQRMTSAGLQAIMKFRNAALEDLGVPRRDRKRAPLREWSSTDFARVQREVETLAGPGPRPASEPLGSDASTESLARGGDAPD